MKKELIFILIIFVLASFAYALQYNLPDDIPNVEGVSGGGGGGGTPSLSIDPNTSDLRMLGMISCFDDNRGNDGEDPRTVIYNEKEYYDGTLTGTSDQIIYDEPFLSSNWDPNVAQVTLPPFVLSNPKDIRWEGNCYVYGSAWHQEYEDGQVKGSAYSTGWVRAPNTVFHQNVNWDNNSNNCQVLGGTWLSGGNYDGYRCCGDDWIWVSNLAYNYTPMGVAELYPKYQDNSLCLYSSYPDFGGFKSDNDITKYLGTNSYFCDSTNLGHSSYDPSLKLDNNYRTSPISTSPFYFISHGGKETDLGKWSDHANSNPMVCTVDFDNSPGKGVVFSWQDEATAAQDSQEMCELYLGYNWTGTKCCGAPGSTPTYNDPTPECDSQREANDIETQSGVTVSDVLFKPMFDELCSSPSRLSQNRACYNGSAVDNYRIIPSEPGTNPEIENIYNVNGTLHFCQSDVISPPPGFSSEPKCSIEGTKGDFAICAYGNDSWRNQNDAAGTLGYVGGKYGSLDKEEAKLHESSLPVNVGSTMGLSQPTECCFADSCWDGSTCQPNSTYYWFKESEPYWGEKVTGEDWNDQIDVYRCQEGGWNGPLSPDYDWDHNTDQPQFCVEGYECACTDNDCPGHTSNGCTNVPDYFTGDHFCDNGNWTSRTKLLAAQMAQIAGSGNYELFCDKYEDSVNYFQPLVPNNAFINSVCVLKYSGTDDVVLGFSLNNGFDDTDTEVQDKLISFISSTFGDSLSDCDNAMNAADTSSYGSFRRCKTNNNDYWFNKKSRLLIYSKDGLSVSDPMPGNYASFSSELRQEFHDITGEIATAGPDINIRSISAFSHAHDFNRLYMAKENGYSILGIIEKLYDDYYQDDRNFMGVAYTGVSGVDCDTITSVDTNAFCDNTGSQVIVLEKNSNEDFRYWNDLTAMLRFLG